MNTKNYYKYKRAVPVEYRLPDIFYRKPEAARTVATTAQLRAVLLHNEGRLIACGYVWDIKNRRIGPGVYEITLAKMGGAPV